jgi:hypothetical protein
MQMPQSRAHDLGLRQGQLAASRADADAFLLCSSVTYG